MKKEILHKYLYDNCSENEFEEFVDWANNDSLNKEGKELGFDDWTNFNVPEKNKKDKRYSLLLDKIHHQINLNERTPEKKTTILFSNVTSWFSKAAAILFIPLLGIILYLLTNNDHHFNNLTAEINVDSLEVIAPIGSRTVVQLTDGTKVHLNYGSRMKYPREFVGDTREINLIGEAYFDVAHNADKPFVVKAGNLNVKVLGTEFNVQAYPGDDNISTTLVKGKVSLEEINKSGKIKAIGAMVPGQHVDYSIQSGEIGSSMGNVDKYVAWKDGKLVFDNEPIYNVAAKLNRMFNVDIQVAKEVGELTYTVTFINEPLSLILDLMTETTPIKYSVSQRKKLPDGTYSLQQIKIERR